MRSLVFGALAGMLATTGIAQAQQAFTPTRPVEVVVHTGPGGGNDVFIRSALTAMRRDNMLPVAFNVVNRTGGGSINAMNYLRERAGDSHTIGVFSSVFITDSLVQEQAPTTLDQLTPVAGLVVEPALLVVRPDAPFRTLRDFIEAARAQPGRLRQSGGSILARDAVLRHVLMSATQTDWAFVSFPSSGERVTALLGGHVEMMMIEPSEAGALIRGGRLRPIAQIADQRIDGFPEVPTLQEAGFNVPNVPQLRGIIGPPNMPAAALAYYEDLFRRAAQASAAYKEYLRQAQIENAFMGADDLGRFLHAYTQTMRTILQGAGVRVAR